MSGVIFELSALRADQAAFGYNLQMDEKQLPPWVIPLTICVVVVGLGIGLFYESLTPATIVAIVVIGNVLFFGGYWLLHKVREKR